METVRGKPQRSGRFCSGAFNLDISILVLPNDEDPDSYVSKYGGEKFLEIVKGTQLGRFHY